MARLAPAVRRALNEAGIRRTRLRLEQQLRDIVVTSQDWIWEHDPRRHASRSAAIRCAPPSVMRPRRSSAPTLRSTCTPKTWRRSISPCTRSGPNQRTATNLQARWRHRNGSYRWLERNMLVLLGESGQVMGFRGSERDFTERRRQEKHISRLTRVLKMLSGVNGAHGAHPPAARNPRRGLPPRDLGGRLRQRHGGADRTRHPHRAAHGLVGQRRQPGRAAAHLQHRRDRRGGHQRHRPRAAHRRAAGLQRPAVAGDAAGGARRAAGRGFSQRRGAIRCWWIARRWAR